MMILQVASEDDIKKMTLEEFERYNIQLITNLSDMFHEMLNTIADRTTMPRVAVLAALIEVAVTAIADDEPQRSEDIKLFVSHFVSRATNQEPKQ